MKIKTNWLVGIALFAVAQAAFALTPWQKVQAPVDGKPHSVGGFSNGCIIGAEPIPLEHPAYQVMRTDKIRYFGHPQLLDTIHRITTQAKDNNLGTVLIGDLGMPAGGRFSSGHASHQTGLDADIWLQLPKQRWSKKQLKSPKAIDLVNKAGKAVVPSLWQPEIGELIKLAAKDKSVTRIFVHPAIKKQLCLEAGSDREWLRTVRPWFGHRAHMHIRIACPKDSKGCIDQPLPPAGDGCGDELESWFKESQLPSSKPGKQEPPPPPAICQSLLDNNFKLK